MRKRIKFVKFIEHLLVALPLIFVGGVASYTIFNKNAKDSYYGETINDKVSNIPDSATDFPTNLEYTFISSAFNQYVESANITIDNFYAIYPTDLVQYNGQIDLINFSYDSGNTRCLLKFYSDGVLLSTKTGNNNYDLSFNVLAVQGEVTLYDKFTYFTYNNYSFLNNALPYAMSEFNKFGFNQIRFVQPFLNLFHVGDTNVYIEFINNYINYFLFVECVYFVPMVLYWFIHFGEKIVCKVLDNEGGLDQ